MDIHIGIQVGSVVSILANLMYASYRSSGKFGFGRLLSFWTGFPVTLCIAMVIPARPPRRELADDEDELLAEIRRDRAQRLIAERVAAKAVDYEAADSEADAPT
ncbi:MAG: hypothetical protein IH968_00865 [Gemmatimonadetes bacterium]|nr:hypothetical protein [Gemmatimonadota bacterium]